MPDICQRYAKVMSKNDKDIPKICQRYAKDMSGVITWLQIQNNYLKQRYTKDMPMVCQRQLPKAFVILPKI